MYVCRCARDSLLIQSCHCDVFLVPVAVRAPSYITHRFVARCSFSLLGAPAPVTDPGLCAKTISLWCVGKRRLYRPEECQGIVAVEAGAMPRPYRVRTFLCGLIDLGFGLVGCSSSGRALLCVCAQCEATDTFHVHIHLHGIQCAIVQVLLVLLLAGRGPQAAHMPFMWQQWWVFVARFLVVLCCVVLMASSPQTRRLSVPRCVTHFAGHKNCLQFEDRLWDHCKANETWTCIECKSCAVCESAENDDLMLFCDHCDEGVHM